MKKLIELFSLASLLLLSACKGPGDGGPSAEKKDEMAASPAPEAKKSDTGPIKVGILHSLSGTMAISETSLKDVALMTIESIDRFVLSNVDECFDGSRSRVPIERPIERGRFDGRAEGAPSQSIDTHAARGGERCSSDVRDSVEEARRDDFSRVLARDLSERERCPASDDRVLVARANRQKWHAASAKVNEHSGNGAAVGGSGRARSGLGDPPREDEHQGGDSGFAAINEAFDD